MKAQYLLLATALVAGPAFAQMAAKPATATKTTHTTTTKTAMATKPNTATHTTKTGKTITYDCSKKGNANKTACKKK